MEMYRGMNAASLWDQSRAAGFHLSGFVWTILWGKLDAWTLRRNSKHGI